MNLSALAPTEILKSPNQQVLCHQNLSTPTNGISLTLTNQGKMRRKKRRLAKIRWNRKGSIKCWRRKVKKIRRILKLFCFINLRRKFKTLKKQIEFKDSISNFNSKNNYRGRTLMKTYHKGMRKMMFKIKTGKNK